MIDRVKFCPCMLFLSQRRIRELRGSFKDFLQVDTRIHTQHYATVAIVVDKRQIVSIYVKVLEDGRWWVREVMAVLPSLLRGHNGALIRTPEDYALALTILDHLLGLVGDPWSRYPLPAVGSGNLGYLKLVECAIQIRDPERRFLRGSQFARLSKQYGGTGVFFGESTCCITRNIKFSVYSKNGQMWERDLTPEPEDEATRVEIIYRNANELGKALTGLTSGSGRSRGKISAKDLGGPVVSSLSMADSYRLFKKGLERVSGIGWIPKAADFQTIQDKNARLLAMGLGEGIADPLHVDRALQHFKRGGPCANTFRKAELELRSFAMRQIMGDPLSVIPDDPARIEWADVGWGAREHIWKAFLNGLNAPTQPDPVIAAAWAQSSLQPSRPHTMDMTGAVAPTPPPFHKDIFTDI